MTILGSKGPSSKIVIMGCSNDLTSNVLLCNAGAPWRMTSKELMHTITQWSMGGEKTSLMFLCFFVNVFLHCFDCDAAGK